MQLKVGTTALLYDKVLRLRLSSLGQVMFQVVKARSRIGPEQVDGLRVGVLFISENVVPGATHGLTVITIQIHVNFSLQHFSVYDTPIIEATFGIFDASRSKLLKRTGGVGGAGGGYE